MKSEIYNAFAALNRGADLMLESLAVLQQEGVWDKEHVLQQTEILEHQRSGINRLAHNVMEGRETESEYDFGKMAERTARKLKAKAGDLPKTKAKPRPNQSKGSLHRGHDGPVKRVKSVP